LAKGTSIKGTTHWFLTGLGVITRIESGKEKTSYSFVVTGNELGYQAGQELPHGKIYESKQCYAYRCF